MSHILTGDQEEALGYESQILVQGIKIGLASPKYYCTGEIPVTLGGTDYTPRGLTVSSIPIGPSSSSRATVRLADQDSELALLWFAERFTGLTVTITEAILKDGEWVITKSVPWLCTGAGRDTNGNFTISLSGAGGMRPRAGLTVATRDDFPFAPEPGTIIRLYDGEITVG
jgi:hypothetical protein